MMTDEKAAFLKVFNDLKQKASNLAALKNECAGLEEHIAELKAEHAKASAKKAVETGALTPEPTKLKEAKARLESINALLPAGETHLHTLAEELKISAINLWAKTETELGKRLNDAERNVREMMEKAGEALAAVENNERAMVTKLRIASRPLLEAWDANSIIEGVESLITFDNQD
jgi:chromosome segregation ATPase